MARSTVYAALRLDKLIERAIRKKGFSVVEVYTPCPTAYGRRNKLGSGADMLLQLKEDSVTTEAAATMSAEDLEGKIVTGVLVDVERPEFADEYYKLSQRLMQKSEGAMAQHT